MAQMEGKLMGVLAAFILAVVGIALLTGVANSSVATTQLYTVTNESVTLTNNTVSNLANTQLAAVTRVGNASLTVGTNFYTVDLDAGEITAVWAGNATLANRAYDVSYTYYEVKNSTARVFVGSLLILFFALAVVLNVYGGVGPNLREMFNFR